ncbi:MAG: sugar phosphate isomerase/epimerase [Acidobacteria bacterium]|nr:sugar phosphate isomerase/epimerase [Acidobacteriota bacterium]
MLRREFIACLAGGLAAGMLGDESVSRAARRRRIPRSRYFLGRIGVSSRSFHNYFYSQQEENYQEPHEMLALLDFPEMIADRYRIHRLEFATPHFGSTEPAYIQELRTQMIRTHSQLVNIAVGIEELSDGGGLSDPEEAVRERALEASKTWIDIAAQLKARSVRCDPGKLNPQNLEPAIDSYQKLAAYGRTKRVRVIVENHGGAGSDHPAELVRLIKRVKSAYFGALPDFGNFSDQKTRARGLALLFPYAPTVCHAGGLEFDATGNEMKYDFPACVAIARRARFHGTYSVEYEGPGDAYQGVQSVIDELLRYL